MLQLRATTQADFEAYLPRAIDQLARELARARDLPKPPALELARGSFRSLFPAGRVDSPDQFFYDLVADGEKVGILHLGVRREDTIPYIYIWDFEIFASFRGHGHARAALAAAEARARELGYGQIRLNVFGHNGPARRLYETCGYRELAILMGKTL